MFSHRGEVLDSGDVFPLEDIPSVKAPEQAAREMSGWFEAAVISGEYAADAAETMLLA